MERIFVFANEAGSVAELTSGAKASGASVALVTSGKTYGCADEVFAYPEEVSLVSVLSAVSELIVSQKPQLLLCESGSDGRLLAGYTAAKLGVSPLCDVMSLSCTADAVETTRLVYGGSAVKTEQCAFPAVAIVCAGTFEASDAAAEPQVTQINCSGSCSVELAGTSAVEASTVNLAAAKRVVGVGRGLASADNIPAAEKLAPDQVPPSHRQRRGGRSLGPRACRRARRGDRLHPPRRGGRALVQQGSLYRRFRRYDKAELLSGYRHLRTDSAHGRRQSDQCHLRDQQG